MTQKEYRVARFPENFDRFREKKIVLYGTGANTEAVLLAYRDSFRFIGLMDREKTGQTCYGLPVLSEEEALEAGAEVMILSAMVDKLDLLYQRVAPFCRENGILLYDLYGKDEAALHEKAEGAPFRHLDDWKALCAGYRTVSMSMVDTVLGPDLFRPGHYRVRPVFLELLRWLQQEGICPVFVGSPDYPEALQRQALEEKGIGTEGRFFLQDWKQDFFLRLRERYPDGAMLHIGTSLLWDCIAPELFGIDTARMVFQNPHPGRLTAAPAGALNGADARAAVSSGSGNGPDIRAEERAGTLTGAEESAGFTGPTGREALLREIRESDVVSFDVFDTLLLRLVPEPEDVFRILEAEAGEKGIAFSAELRRKLQDYYPEENLDGLYGILKEGLGLTGGEAAFLKERELSLEKDLIRPRAPVVSLYREALELRKTVVLTTDMYLTEEQLLPLLSGAGITGFHRLFLSSSAGRTKWNGLFSEVRAFAGEGRRILHIGDSPEFDVRAAEDAGIRGVHLPSALQLAEGAGFTDILKQAENLSERLLLGLLAAECFADPFRGPETGALDAGNPNAGNPNAGELNAGELNAGGPDAGVPATGDLERYAVLGAFPIVSGYLSWLAKRLREDHRDRMLFAARDGWLLREAYEILRAREPDLPPSVYFYTSRRAAFLSCASERGFAGYFAWRGAGKRPEALMRDVYDLSDGDIIPWKAGTELTPGSLKEYILLHEAAVREKERESRQRFFRYLWSTGVKPGEKLGFAELIAAGFCQAFLERVMPCTVQGYSVGRREMEQALPVHVESWIPEGSGGILGRFMEFEWWMAAPEPSAAGYTEDGRPVFFPEERTEEELRRLQAFQETLRRLLREYFTLFYRRGEVIRPELAGELYRRAGTPAGKLRFFDSWLQEDQS